MQRTFTIPSSFKIKGQVVRVQYDDEYCSDEKLHGEADFSELLITLCKRYKGRRLGKKEIELVFFHELAHILLHFCNKHKQKYDEDFVEDIGVCLRDFFKSCK